MDIDEEIKEGFLKLVNDFLRDLFEVADFDPNEELNQQLKKDVEGAQQYARPSNAIWTIIGEKFERKLFVI